MCELHDTVICNQCIKKCISSYESKQIQNRKESKGCSLRLNTWLSAHWQALWHEMKQNVNLSVCSGFILARRVGEKDSLCSNDKMFKDEKDHNKFEGENNKVNGASFIRNEKTPLAKSNYLLHFWKKQHIWQERGLIIFIRYCLDCEDLLFPFLQDIK